MGLVLLARDSDSDSDSDSDCFFIPSFFFIFYFYCGIFKALQQTRHRPYMGFVSTSYRDGRRSTLRCFEYGGEKKNIYYFILFFNFLPEYSPVVISLSFSLRQVINNIFSMRWLIYAIFFFSTNCKGLIYPELRLRTNPKVFFTISSYG